MTEQFNRSGRRIGYIRENLLCDDLKEQLQGIPLDRVFTDRIDRVKQFLSQFAVMKSYLQNGDTLIVQRLDRLARRPEECLDLIYELTSRGIRIECVTEKIIFPAGEESPLRNLLLLIMGTFYEASQSWISERRREARASWKPFVSEDKKP